MVEERRVHPDCINASNPYRECVEYCFRKIAEAKAQMTEKVTEVVQASGGGGQSNTFAPNVVEDLHDQRPNLEEDSDNDNSKPIEENVDVDFTKLTRRKKKLVELRLKMVEVVQTSGGGGQSNTSAPDVAEDLHDQRSNLEEDSDNENSKPAVENVDVDFAKLTGRKKRLFELRLKMNEARKANKQQWLLKRKDWKCHQSLEASLNKNCLRRGRGRSENFWMQMVWI